MKKTIYSVLSLLGFLILAGICSRKISFVKNIKDFDFNLHVEFCGKIILWWGIMMMLPAGILSALTDKLNVSYMWENIFDAAVLVYVYITGVFITRKLYDWKISKGL